MRCAVIDCRMPLAMRQTLLEYVDTVLPMPIFDALAEPVAAHPDMLLWAYGRDILTFREYRRIAEKEFSVLEELGYRINDIEEAAASVYPNDVLLNCAVVGNYLIANERTVSKAIKSIAEKETLTLLNVRQGYTKCSVAVVGNAVITADASIHKAVSKAGVDSLLICSEGVSLSGYNCGFIGGATGSVGNDLLFCGSVDLHPDGALIREFCEKKGIRAVSLSPSPLYDFGTVIVLEKQI